MTYNPEHLTIEIDDKNVATISNHDEKIAKINLNHPVWQWGVEHATDEQYMQSVELLGSTQKLVGLGAHYQKGGKIIPVFKSRETRDKTKIFYDSDSFRETKRDCGDKIYKARFNSYEYMQGLIVTDYIGYEISDKKNELAKIYDQHGKLIAEQIEQNKIKLMSSAGTRFTNLGGAEYAIIEQYGQPTRLSNGCLSIHRMKPKEVTIYDNNDKQMAKFKFYENSKIEECYQLNTKGKRRNYHHYNTKGKEDTFIFSLSNKLSISK